MLYRERKLRHEQKYIIDFATYEILRRRFMVSMAKDVNSQGNDYRITSLYFDDVYHTCYNDKLSGILCRKKFRIRAYNASDSKITLECKYKDDRYVSKTAAPLTLEQYQDMLNGRYSFLAGSDFSGTSGELFFSASCVSLYRPTAIVDYYREAYVSKNGNVRFTFDKNLATCYTSLDMFSSNAQFSSIMDNMMILEVKYDDYLPSFLAGLLSGVPLLEEPVSKYVMAYDAIREAESHPFVAPKKVATAGKTWKIGQQL